MTGVRGKHENRNTKSERQGKETGGENSGDRRQETAGSGPRKGFGVKRRCGQSGRGGSAVAEASAFVKTMADEMADRAGGMDNGQIQKPEM